MTATTCALVGAVFVAAFVELVEAFPIVLAIGRLPRPALGAGRHDAGAR